MSALRDHGLVNVDMPLQELLASEPYWTAKAMQEQGSRFYRALGAALEAADAVNRRRIYEMWTAECFDFYQRGLRLAQLEEAPQEQVQQEGA